MTVVTTLAVVVVTMVLVLGSRQQQQQAADGSRVLVEGESVMKTPALSYGKGWGAWWLVEAAVGWGRRGPVGNKLGETAGRVGGDGGEQRATEGP